MSSKTVRMLDAVEDSHVLTDPKEMEVPPVPGHSVKQTKDKRDRVLTESRVGKLARGGAYVLPTTQADELITLKVAEEVSA